MDAGLGRESAVANIRRMAVRPAVQPLVEFMRYTEKILHLLVGHADLEFVGVLGLELQGRDDRNQIGVAAALAEAVERALDLADAGAHRGKRIRHRLLGVVVGMDAEMIAGHVLHHLPDDGLDLVGQACRRWCRTAPPSSRLPRRPPWRRPARKTDWPCSHRRNARSRASPRGLCPWRPSRCRGSTARFSSSVVSSATRT